MGDPDADWGKSSYTCTSKRRATRLGSREKKDHRIINTNNPWILVKRALCRGTSCFLGTIIPTAAWWCELAPMFACHICGRSLRPPWPGVHLFWGHICWPVFVNLYRILAQSVGWCYVQHGLVQGPDQPERNQGQRPDFHTTSNARVYPQNNTAGPGTCASSRRGYQIKVITNYAMLRANRSDCTWLQRVQSWQKRARWCFNSFHE